MGKIRRLFLMLLLIGGLLFSFGKTSYAQVYTNQKLITIDLKHQMLYAWNNAKVVYSTPISSGLSASPTVKGMYHIYWKLPYQEMRGFSPVHGYYDLPNVPNVMYFYQAYAIHGTYWHHNFGHPMSNGCVNVPLGSDAWLYEFASVGTTVYIY